MQFKRIRLEDIALGGTAGLVDGPFGSNLPATDYVEHGVPVIRGSNLSKGKFRFKDDDFVFVSESTANRLNRSTCVPGDIIFTKKGTLGQVGIVPDRPYPRYLLSSNQMRLRVDSSKANPEFVYYALSTQEAIERVIRDSEHTGVPKINLAYIRTFPIELPERSVQDDCVATIRTLDNRIDLLRQTNTTLEAIAQAVFKSWFIDFDPVRAKAEGREPEGMNAATAALFPAEFEETESGVVPKGWTIAPFGSLLAHTIGGDWGSETESADCSLMATIVRGTDIPDIRAGVYEGVPRRFVSPKKATRRTLEDGDLIIEVSGGSKTQPTGRSLYVTRELLVRLGGTVVPTSFCRLFRAINPHTALLLRQHLDAIYRDGKMWNYQVQSTGLANFQTQHFLDSEMVVAAPPAICASFYEIVRPLIDRINTAPTMELQALRDALLPRLISGKLRVPEAEALLERAVA